MQNLTFRQLPWVVRIAVGVAFLNLWVNIEGLVIDRYGIWKYMPYYKVGDACVWDLTVTIIIAFAIWRASRQSEGRTA